MNATGFIALLAALDDTVWAQVIDGRALRLVDDRDLELGPSGATDAILTAGAQTSAAALRAETLAEAGDILANFYLTHPLTEAGFNRRARELVAEHGAAAFAGPFGPPPARTLFVDGGELLALDRGDPRHRYGAYCELDAPLTGEALHRRVDRWIDRGEAYQRYLGMNACRYNC